MPCAGGARSISLGFNANSRRDWQGDMKSTGITQMICDKARRFGDKPALSMHGDPDEHYSYRGLDEASAALATGLIGLGLHPGARVAILSESRPRWGVAFFAAIRAGAVVVPLDFRQTAAELRHIIEDAEPSFLLVSKTQEAMAATLVGNCRKLLVFTLDEGNSELRYESIDRISTRNEKPCVIREEGDVAVITYTSGTMGTSKGVATTFGNLLFEIRAVRTVMQNDAHVATVSVLPLSHLFELTAGFLGVLYGGGSIHFCASLLPQEIVAAMREQRVTCMTTVPLFLKLFADSIARRVAEQPRWRQTCFAVSRQIARYLPMFVRRRLFSSIHDVLGGRLEYFVCGGAPLAAQTEAFFTSIGFPVYQGYGLAETSPVLSTNGPSSHRSGSVGKPLPGVEVRIAEGGEILTRGPQVMQGYFRQPGLTASIVDAHGWLHTGDVGRIDKDGFLYIDGRQKNIIVLGNGKKVQPEELENVLFEHPYIAEGCVVAGAGPDANTEEVCAIAVATDTAVRYCREHAKNLGDMMRRIVEAQARTLAPAKRPTRIYLRTEPLPRTSTRKVRRPDVRRWLSEQGALS